MTPLGIAIGIVIVAAVMTLMLVVTWSVTGDDNADMWGDDDGE